MKKTDEIKVSIALYGTYNEHDKLFDRAIEAYSDAFPGMVIFPVYIGEVPEELNGPSVYKFSSLDINPAYLSYMFSNFKNPVLFTKVDTIPGKLKLDDSIIKTSVNISYSRKFLFSCVTKTLSYIDNKTKVDVAIIDNTKKFGVTELPINIIRTPSIVRIENLSLEKQIPEKFQIKTEAEDLRERGYYLERVY